MEAVRGTITGRQVLITAIEDPQLLRGLRKMLGRAALARLLADIRAGVDDDQLGHAYDALDDWFGNYGPRLVEFEAMGSSAGAYNIVVTGVANLCTALAPDFGRYGYFPSVDAACQYISSEWESATEIWRSDVLSRVAPEMSPLNSVGQETLGLTQQSGKFTPVSQELQQHWERGHQQVMQHMRASGLTVTERGPSDTTELQATLPQGKRPTSARQQGPQKAKEE